MCSPLAARIRLRGSGYALASGCAHTPPRLRLCARLWLRAYASVAPAMCSPLAARIRRRKLLRVNHATNRALRMLKNDTMPHRLSAPRLLTVTLETPAFWREERAPPTQKCAP